MPRDALSPDAVVDVADQERHRAYRCAACGALVTLGRWEMAMNGDHEHVVFNPAGVVFRVLCFREAPGAAEIGPASGEFTWFRGYAWRLALCRACRAHLGWRYEGDAEPRIFFGLIKAALKPA